MSNNFRLISVSNLSGMGHRVGGWTGAADRVAGTVAAVGWQASVLANGRGKRSRATDIIDAFTRRS
jgi:hydrogenase maturation factor HypE